MNADGKLDFMEFSIACKLINAKLRGFDIPKVLPPNLRNSASTGIAGNFILILLILIPRLHSHKEILYF